LKTHDQRLKILTLFWDRPRSTITEATHKKVHLMSTAQYNSTTYQPIEHYFKKSIEYRKWVNGTNMNFAATK
jgi:hypothetical protein